MTQPIERPSLRSSLETVYVVTITPRRRDRTVDVDGIRRNTRYLVDAGVVVVMPQCGTGLVYDSTLDEYRAAVEATIDEAKGKAFVIPGVGPGFGRALEMGRVARSVGADAVMIMPIVGPSSPEGVYTGMRDLVKAMELPIVLYVRNLEIFPLKYVIELSRMEEIYAVKYAVNDVPSFDTFVREIGNTVVPLCGMAEEPALEYMAHGAKGYSSGMANFIPRLSLRMYQAYRSGDHQEAGRLREFFIPFEHLRGEQRSRYNASALHVAMEMVGLAGGPVIPMNVDVPPEELPRVQTMVEALMKEESSMPPSGHHEG